ncbi:unnamed protein product, partial [Mycena citricolor]
TSTTLCSGRTWHLPLRASSRMARSRLHSNATSGPWMLSRRSSTPRRLPSRAVGGAGSCVDPDERDGRAVTNDWPGI